MPAISAHGAPARTTAGNLEHRFPGAAPLLRHLVEAPPMIPSRDREGTFLLRAGDLVAHLPACADETASLMHAPSGFAIRVRRAGANASVARVEGGGVVYGVATAIQAVFFPVGTAGIEELLLLHGPGSIVYDLELPPGGRLVHDGSRGVVVMDPSGRSRLWFAAPAAWDSAGRRVPLRVTRTRSSIRVEVLGAPVWPVLVDPVWMPTGAMMETRAWHTATLLPSGQVLVTGGCSSSVPPRASAELYDPSTGTWSTTGAMAAARCFHTATLLPGGEVLVLPAPERYDPGTGTWTPGASPILERWGHTATLLPSGEVLVAGGWNSMGPVTTAEIYDPTTDTWTLTGALQEDREWHTATLLPSGQVLVAGGIGAPPVILVDSAELYDPATGTWTLTGMLSTYRDAHTATALASGDVLVVGVMGNDPWSVVPAERYDVALGVWLTAGTPALDRYQHTATRLPVGDVLVCGGIGLFGGEASCELYDPLSDTWALDATLNGQRFLHTATLLPSGEVLVVGGLMPTLMGDAITLATAEFYGPDPCTIDADCDDGQSCNGLEVCDVTMQCFPGTPPLLDDGINCTLDACDEAAGGAVHVPDDTPCDDSDPCTDDLCDSATGCRHVFNVAPCDDADPCTTDDACNGAGQCLGLLGVCSDAGLEDAGAPGSDAGIPARGCGCSCRLSLAPRSMSALNRVLAAVAVLLLAGATAVRRLQRRHRSFANTRPSRRLATTTARRVRGPRPIELQRIAALRKGGDVPSPM